MHGYKYKMRKEGRKASDVKGRVRSRGLGFEHFVLKFLVMAGVEESVAEKESSGCVVDMCLGDAVVDLTGHVHQLPCCIKHSGPCFVSHYFKPNRTGIEVEDLKVEEAFFRGRKLQGTTMHLPEGYSGFVLGKKSSNTAKPPGKSEGNVIGWETKAKFQAITYWNHDSLPSQDDAYLRSFHWLAVSGALHKPARAEDLKAASLSLKQELYSSEK